MKTPASITISRLLFLLVCGLGGMAVASGAQDGEVSILTGFLGGMAVAGFVILVEWSIQSYSLRGFSTATVGLFFGLISAWLLTKVGVVELLIGGFRLEGELSDTIRLAFHTSLFAGLSFIGVMLALRTSPEDFAFIIPYVRFREDEMSGRPVVLDAYVIGDGRLPKLLESGLIGGRVIVPRFVLDELKELSVSSDAGLNERARRGLNMLDEIRRDGQVPLSVHDSRMSAEGGMEARLAETAKLLDARLLTTNDQVAKEVRLGGGKVLNLNDLFDALKPELVVGETIRVFLNRLGKDDDQAVGYSSDGKMIVVNNGAGMIGKVKDVRIIRKIETSAGEMVFSELVELGNKERH